MARQTERIVPFGMDPLFLFYRAARCHEISQNSRLAIFTMCEYIIRSDIELFLDTGAK